MGWVVCNTPRSRTLACAQTISLPAPTSGKGACEAGPTGEGKNVPVYAYRCQGCGVEFDIHQSFSDDPLTVCEDCGGELRKLLGSVGVSFKGSGFYSTDRGGSTKSRGSGAKPSAGGSAPLPPPPPELGPGPKPAVAPSASSSS